ncbi:MAG: B12-binding domain-containing radical SAM protein, partial [Desulfobacteraceae bacterium]|nr:B12-binding domain-containing radical SAM protein [Desulfobacteraceae bacterium]
MTETTLEELLPLVDKASRYMGSEINSVKKDPDLMKLRIALAFPDLYEIGTSHFGIQILYSILNREADFAA